MYREQDCIVDHVFPSIGCRGFDPDFDVQQFSQFGFWREEVLDISHLQFGLV